MQGTLVGNNFKDIVIFEDFTKLSIIKMKIYIHIFGASAAWLGHPMPSDPHQTMYRIVQFQQSFCICSESSANQALANSGFGCIPSM